jgi:hypothetical protein
MSGRGAFAKRMRAARDRGSGMVDSSRRRPRGADFYSARRVHSRAMARISRLEKLFTAVAAQDWAKARAGALAIAEDEEASRHLPAAQRLRSAIGQVNGVAHVLPTNGKAFASESALTQISSLPSLQEMVLTASTRSDLTTLVEEWNHRTRLQAAGVRRRSRILLHGPPGCGKSMSAAALGHETGLPVYVVRLDAIVGSYLGETASRVHSVLRWASTRQSVLVLDEVDAIARRRGHAADVAELDRVVVALLQELEHTTPSGFLIATTNRLDDLDPALFRRFDLVMKIPQPSRASLAAFSVHQAARLGVRLSPKFRKAAMSAGSFADAFRVIENLARDQLISRSE